MRNEMKYKPYVYLNRIMILIRVIKVERIYKPQTHQPIEKEDFEFLKRHVPITPPNVAD